MTIRELRIEEWGRLEGQEIFATVGVPSPESTRVLIAETESGELAAIWCMVQVIHIEPVWIAPAYRNSTLAGRMWNRMKVFLDHLRVDMSYCFADTPEIAQYLKRLGLKKLPYETFLFDPKGKYPEVKN
jgi:hypothetical protein